VDVSGKPMSPSLGLLLFSDYDVAELVSLAQQSEGLGYQYFWYTDVRFARECYIALAAVALGTKTIRIGTGVTDPYSRHPAITAAAIATLDELSGGRAVLGIGIGGAGFKELGIEKTLPIAAMREAVEMINGLIAGEKVTTQGKVFAVDGGKLSFQPVRSKIPVYFATHGAQMTRLAGQIADGVLIANVLQPSAFDFYTGKLDEGIAKAGRDAATVDVGLRVEACINDDDAAAFTVMRKRVASRILSQYPHWDYLAELNVTLPDEFAALAQERSTEAAAKAAALLPRDAVEAMVLVGSPERVAEQLARALTPRVTQITLRPHAAPGQKIGDVIAAFANEVVPRALSLVSAEAGETT